MLTLVKTPQLRYFWHISLDGLTRRLPANSCTRRNTNLCHHPIDQDLYAGQIIGERLKSGPARQGFRTALGPKGSTAKEITLGAAGVPGSSVLPITCVSLRIECCG